MTKSKKPSNFLLPVIGNTCTDPCLEIAKICHIVLVGESKGVGTAGSSSHLLKEMDFGLCVCVGGWGLGEGDASEEKNEKLYVVVEV